MLLNLIQSVAIMTVFHLENSGHAVLGQELKLHVNAPEYVNRVKRDFRQPAHNTVPPVTVKNFRAEDNTLASKTVTPSALDPAHRGDELAMANTPVITADLRLPGSSTKSTVFRSTLPDLRSATNTSQHGLNAAGAPRFISLNQKFFEDIKPFLTSLGARGSRKRDYTYSENEESSSTIPPMLQNEANATNSISQDTTSYVGSRAVVTPSNRNITEPNDNITVTHFSAEPEHEYGSSSFTITSEQSDETTIDRDRRLFFLSGLGNFYFGSRLASPFGSSRDDPRKLLSSTPPPAKSTSGEESDGTTVDFERRLLFLSGRGVSKIGLSRDNPSTPPLTDRQQETTAEVKRGAIQSKRPDQNTQEETSVDENRGVLVHGKRPDQARDSKWTTNGLGDGQDIVPALRRCGVFPACALSVDPLDHTDVAEQETFFPSSRLFGKYHTRVTCDSTSVSVLVSITIILSVVIIVSNILIIIVTLRAKNLRKPHGYFKISLALADLVNGAFVLPNVGSNLTQDIYFDGRDIMQLNQIRRREPDHSEASFFGICAVVAQVVTVYSVLLLSLDSFLSVRWPMKYRVGDLMTPRRATILVILVWLFAVAVSSLPLAAHQYVTYGLSYTTFSYFPVVAPLSQYMTDEQAFSARYIHVICYAIFVWGIPFVTTWTLTMLTAFYSRGMLRSMDAARKKASNLTKTIGRLERDIMRTVTVVLTLLTATVMPMLIAMLTILVTTDDNALCMEQYVSNILFSGYYILACGSFVNVIVYNACHKEFRRSSFDFLCDVITLICGGCCPKYCDMEPVKSNRYRRQNASARATTRTTLDNRRTRHSSHISTVMSHGLRHNTMQTSTKGTVSTSSSVYTPNGMHRNRHLSSKYYADHTTAERTFSNVSAFQFTRDKCLSSSSTRSPQTYRKLARNRSSSLSDVFLPSPDPAPIEESQENTHV